MSSKKQLAIKLITDKDTSIEKVIHWKIWFDEKNQKPVGTGFYVAVCGLDEKLPPIINKPSHVKEKEVMLLVFNKKEKSNDRFNR